MAGGTGGVELTPKGWHEKKINMLQAAHTIILVQTQAVIAPRKSRLCTATSCKLPHLFHLANCTRLSLDSFAGPFWGAQQQQHQQPKQQRRLAGDVNAGKKTWPRKLLKIGQNNIACRFPKFAWRNLCLSFDVFMANEGGNGIHNLFRSKNPFQALSQKPVLPDTRPRSKAPAAP